MRGALVIVLMAHRCYQRGLPIAPALPPDACPLGRARTAAIAAQQNPAPQGAPRGQMHRHPLRAHLLRDHAFAGQQREPRSLGHRREKRRIKPPIFHHEPHRAFFQFGMVKGQEKRRRALACAAIAGPDLQDRLHLGLQPGPDANRGQQPLGGDRQRIGAAVKPHIGPRWGGACVDHHHPQARLRQGQPQGRAIQPAAHDQNIGIMFHMPQYGPPGGIVHAPPCR